MDSWVGLIDFDLGSSTVCLVLLRLIGKLAELTEQLGKMVEHKLHN